MKVVATYSIKGGVGKTTAAVNLAATAALAGNRILLWDLDPQGAATFMFRVKPKVRGGGRGLITGRRSVADAVRATDVANLDLVPGDFRYRHLDLVLDGMKRPTDRLGELLAPLASEYDLVVLDCAPSISLVSEGVFGAADLLLVPLVPSTLSLRTLDQLLDFLDGRPPVRTGTGIERLCAVLAYFSMVDRRRRLHRDTIASLPLQRPGVMAAALVPSASVVERMGVMRAPLKQFAPSSEAAAAFEQLWAEVQARLSV